MKETKTLLTLEPKTKESKQRKTLIQKTTLFLMAFGMILTQYYGSIYAAVEVPEVVMTLINTAVVIIGVGLAIRGLIVMVPGIGDYTGAEDDDAAAKKKGRDQITSGVKLMVVGAVIVAVGASGMIGNAVQGLANLIQIG